MLTTAPRHPRGEAPSTAHPERRAPPASRAGRLASSRPPHAASHEAGDISCYTYVARRAVPPGWSTPRPMRVSRALQEMLLHLDATAMPDDLRLRTQRVIIEMLEEDTLPAIEVPVPEDRRIQVLADDVMRDPESDLSVEGWAARHALSVRTVTRTFSRDVGMPFARWRSLVRMSAATALLTQGHPVNLVAHRSGYATTSAFCAAFHRVTAAALYFHRLFGPVGALLGSLDDIQRATVGLARLVGITDLADDRDDRAAVPRPARAPDPPEIAVRNVSFSYDGLRPALSEVALTVPAGGSVALVGASGSGKSTLARLIAGMGEPTAGRITVGAAGAPAVRYLVTWRWPASCSPTRPWSCSTRPPPSPGRGPAICCGRHSPG